MLLYSVFALIIRTLFWAAAYPGFSDISLYKIFDSLGNLKTKKEILHQNEPD
jgi:hypothetical protein